MMNLFRLECVRKLFNNRHLYCSLILSLQINYLKETLVMILPYKSKNWIDLYDASVIISNDTDYKPDGFWVVFIRGNIGINADKQMEFVENVILFMTQHEVSFAKIALPYYDRLLVFTDCSKRKINKIGNALKNFFSFGSKNMIWEAVFESEDSWEKNGWLNRLNQSFEKFEEMIPKDIKGRKKYEYAVSLRSIAYQKMLEEKIMKRESMVVKPIFGEVDYSIKDNSVFIIMPFGEAWSDDVSEGIKSVCDKYDIIAQRADNMFDTQKDVISDIWKGINEAELIIADVSVRNANVFYELGIAHTLGKDIVLLHQKDSEPIPFDISTRRYIEYGMYPKAFSKFQEDLGSVIKAFFEK